MAATAAVPARVRCAIYTRKSTEAGLDRDFNSLDNQRERAEAYAASQGWTPVASRYNDAGFSGGTTDRPALKRLLRDVEDGQLDALIVYRLDRLSRSLRDFLGIHEFLEKHGVALVSVTESINTSTPHGRMMVNVLLSFSQYERELAGERTRHKIEGSRRRGRWTGGRPVAGFDAMDGRLVVNNAEADQVRAVFRLYAETPSLTRVVTELNRRGWTNKAWVTKTGHRCGGGRWTIPSLRTLLTNALYIGKQRAGDELFPGEHKAIITKKLFKRVQDLMSKNRSDGGAVARNTHGFLLRGLVRCSACDSAMSPGTAKSKGKRYRYYTCGKNQRNGRDTCATKSIPAGKVEQFVIDQIRRIGADAELQGQTLRQAVAQVKAQRRGLRVERKRLERDLLKARGEVERLVTTISRTTRPAADAVAAELRKVQQRAETLEGRLREIDNELTILKTQEVDRDDLGRALQEFDPIWDVLLTPERERVMHLLIERIKYNGRTKRMTIAWRLTGFGQLAKEMS